MVYEFEICKYNVKEMSPAKPVCSVDPSLYVNMKPVGQMPYLASTVKPVTNLEELNAGMFHEGVGRGLIVAKSFCKNVTFIYGL